MMASTSVFVYTLSASQTRFRNGVAMHVAMPFFRIFINTLVIFQQGAKPWTGLEIPGIDIRSRNSKLWISALFLKFKLLDAMKPQWLRSLFTKAIHNYLNTVPSCSPEQVAFCFSDEAPCSLSKNTYLVLGINICPLSLATTLNKRQREEASQLYTKAIYHYKSPRYIWTNFHSDTIRIEGAELAQVKN